MSNEEVYIIEQTTKIGHAAAQLVNGKLVAMDAESFARKKSVRLASPCFILRPITNEWQLMKHNLAKYQTCLGIYC